MSTTLRQSLVDSPPDTKTLPIWSMELANIGAIDRFQSSNPATGETLEEVYPVSSWSDCDRVLEAASKAFVELQRIAPEKRAEFLECFADKLEASKDAIVAMAHQETGLRSPRDWQKLNCSDDNQLRQAAAAARDGSWAMATIDSKLNIRSVYESLGPICVFGPNNFPFAYNGVAGGDFAAAIAAGNPVIGKANTSHPGTSRLLAEQALAAIQRLGCPRLWCKCSIGQATRMVSVWFRTIA